MIHVIAGLTTPFRYQFFNNGIIVATIAGALCGLLGVFVVLRGMSYIGHGLSHAVFGGAAASAVMNINYFVGAGVWGVASGVIIGRIARRRLIGADAAIGVVTTASFALGLALLNRYGQAKKSIEAVLFGSVLGVKTIDIVAVSAVAILSVVIVVALYRAFLFATFDPEVAQVSGVRVAWIEALLMLSGAISRAFSYASTASISLTFFISSVTTLSGATFTASFTFLGFDI